jgi:hypothetical protein
MPVLVAPRWVAANNEALLSNSSKGLRSAVKLLKELMFRRGPVEDGLLNQTCEQSVCEDGWEDVARSHYSDTVPIATARTLESHRSPRALSKATAASSSLVTKKVESSATSFDHSRVPCQAEFWLENSGHETTGQRFSAWHFPALAKSGHAISRAERKSPSGPIGMSRQRYA